jgi:proteasome activator subunit 4
MFVWPEEFIGYKTPSQSLNLEYSPEVLEQLKFLAPKFDREWVHQQFGYLSEESSRSGSGLRSPEAYCWPLLFRLFRGLEGAITEQEIQEEIVELLDDGTEKSRHQATFEVVFSLIMSLKFAPDDYVRRTWEWLLPFLLNIFESMLRPDNVGFWRTFLTSILVLSRIFRGY